MRSRPDDAPSESSRPPSVPADERAGSSKAGPSRPGAGALDPDARLRVDADGAHADDADADDADATLAQALVLRDGRLDAGLLLGTWLLRRLSWVTLWLGVIVAILAGQESALLDEELLTIDSVRANILSPLAGVILAVGMRIGASLGAVAIAYPLARAFERTRDAGRDGGRGRRRSNPGVWMDRYRAAKGLRQLRWTSGVRRLARGRLGPLGPVIQRIDVVLLVSGIVLIPVAIVVLVLNVSA